MKVWRTATVSLFFGVFLYFVTLGELWFALIPVLLLVSFMIVSRIPFKASSKAERASILMIAVPCLFKTVIKQMICAISSFYLSC